jgi:localization factor PodJL
MTSKRSYLENVNAGRQRRPGPAPNDINQNISQTLSQLEGRLGRALDAGKHNGQNESNIAQRLELLSKRFGKPRRSEEQPSRQNDTSPRANLEWIAREIENSRHQEDQLASIGGIATELKALREEMLGSGNSDLRHELSGLRQDFDRIAATQRSSLPHEMHNEFERLSNAIERLVERSDDKGTKLMRLELEQVKSALSDMAREDTVRSLENRLRGSDPLLERLGARLDEISAAINSLPESLSLRSLEDGVRMLAVALDRFVEQRDKNGPDLYALVEERLDEISRAITASAALAHSPAFDAAQLQRVEARIASLASQLEELVQNRSDGVIAERLGALYERVDEIARRINVPEQAMDRVTSLIAQISEKLDSSPPQRQADRLFRGLEDRFSHLSELIARRAQETIQQGHVLFQDLERRLEEMAERLEQGANTIDTENGLIAALDDRFAELAAHLSNARHNPGGDGRLHSLEARLDDISGRLQTSAAAASVDPEVIRNLQKQVASLAAHLERPGREPPALEDLRPRLEKIERSIEQYRAAVLDAARRAAEEVAERLTAARPQDDRLRAELEKLQTLTRKSDERNIKTFDAIHDTLLKIVNRLSSLEAGAEKHGAADETSSPDAAIRLLHERVAPSPTAAAVKRAPGEPAAASELSDDEVEEEAQEPRRLLAGLSRAFSDKRGELDTPREDPILADDDLDIDLERLNEPLEPGSGKPDINAIMRRVREQHDARGRSVDEVTKADFIAAARRAAQAAAAEAELDGKGKGRRKRGASAKILGRHKKQVLLTMGAGVLLAGGVYFGGGVIRATQNLAIFQTEDSLPKVVESTSLDVDPIKVQTAPAPSAPAAAQPAEVAKSDRAAEKIPEITSQFSSASTSESNDARQETSRLNAHQEADEPDSVARLISEQPALPHEHIPSLSSPEGVQLPTSLTTSEPLQTAPDPVWNAQLPEIPAEIEPAALRDAAASGKPEALYEIASRYAEGRGVAVNMGEAAKWYEHAAERGLAPAQYRIGNLYEKGMGVERDLSKAKMWYRLAADQGNANAMHNLGVLFAIGVDGAADNSSAAQWFQEAADLGVTDSQFNLGILAAKGAGVPLDLIEAHKWFDIVARTGDTDAAAKRDEVAKTLSPEDLTEAQGRAKLWTAREGNPMANVVSIPSEWTPSQEITATVDMKKAISNVQLILTRIGYDPGPADGVMGEKTRSAIRSFQKQNGLEETGEIDEPLVRALLERNNSGS